MEVRDIISLFLLLTFLAINLWLSLARLITRITGRILRKALRIELPENKKKNIERLFIPAWIVIGLYGAWKVRWDYLAMIFAFLAFRSGAGVSRILIYSHHDGKLLEKIENKLLRTVAKITKLGLLLEGTFILAFALAYKTLSAVSTSKGPVGQLILELWFFGLIFGFVFFWLVARDNDGILLKDQIALVLLFAGKRTAEKTGETVKLVKSKKNSLVSRFKK